MQRRLDFLVWNSIRVDVERGINFYMPGFTAFRPFVLFKLAAITAVLITVFGRALVHFAGFYFGFSGFTLELKYFLPLFVYLYLLSRKQFQQHID
jgi:hypothetical protein